jgi:hypothetical protein
MIPPFVPPRILRGLTCFVLALTRFQLEANDFFAPLIKHVRATLQEQHSEDVFFEFRGIHLAPKDVCGFEEVSLELRKGQRHLFVFRVSKA